MAINNIVITAMGGVTPVGGNIDQTCCAIRAGINLFEEHEFYQCQPFDPEWDPMLPLIAAAFPLNDPLADGFTRMLDMAVMAVKEIMDKLAIKRSSLPRTGLLLALPELDQASATWQLQEHFIDTLCGKTGLTALGVKSVDFHGRTGAVRQLSKAISLIENGQLDICIVGGVDTMLAEDRINYFDRQWRIRSERTADGFIPGEACVTLAVEKLEYATARQMQPLAAVSGFAFANEKQPVTSEKQSSGNGISEVLDAVMQQAQISPLKWTVSDMNGESYTGFEWGTGLVRNGQYFSDTHRLDHPADCVGEIGAAAGALILAVAAHAFANDYHKSNEVLLFNAADSGDRATAILRKI